MFDSVGASELQNAGKAGLVTVQGKISAVLGTVLICKWEFFCGNFVLFYFLSLHLVSFWLHTQICRCISFHNFLSWPSGKAPSVSSIKLINGYPPSSTWEKPRMLEWKLRLSIPILRGEEVYEEDLQKKKKIVRIRSVISQFVLFNCSAWFNFGKFVLLIILNIWSTESQCHCYNNTMLENILRKGKGQVEDDDVFPDIS